ncbi:MAG TPA: SWIM zinc finger family protein [Kineosporiaceae bacterium]
MTTRAPGAQVLAPAAGAGARGDPVTAEAARRRAQQRERRMLDGLAELDQWLHDQVRAGIAGTDRAGYQPFDILAARMVDAQVPSVAARVRQLAAIAVSGEGWPARLLEEYALLHLLASAAPVALADPASAFAATVRAHLGVNVSQHDVRTTPADRDRWAVLAFRDDVEERLTARRVWLRGERSGRLAVVMSFAVAGQPLDSSLVPGTTLDAELHHYPGAVPWRALVGARHAVVPGVAVPAGGPGLAAALEEWAAVLARDPWLRAWPVMLGGVVPVLDADGWWLVDGSGSLPLVAVGEAGWGLLATSGGHPVSLLAELVPGGVRPVRAFRAVVR